MDILCSGERVHVFNHRLGIDGTKMVIVIGESAPLIEMAVPRNWFMRGGADSYVDVNGLRLQKLNTQGASQS